MPRAVRIAVAGLVLSVLTACSTAAYVHSEYRSFAIDRIGVAPVGNDTVFALDSVTFGGMLQRGLLTPRVYDVPKILAGSIQKTLLEKNYETISLPGSPGEGWRVAIEPERESPAESESGSVAADPPPSETPSPERPTPPDVDATMHCVIVGWKARTSGQPEFRIEFSLSLDRAGHRIYGGTFRGHYVERGHRRSHDSVPRAIHAAVERALAALPVAATGVEGAAAP